MNTEYKPGDIVVYREGTFLAGKTRVLHKIRTDRPNAWWYTSGGWDNENVFQLYKRAENYTQEELAWFN